MAVDLSPIGGAGAQFFDNNGVPLSGGKLYTYAAATTTPKASYTSAAGTVPHSNPIILDSAGRVPGGEIWLTSGEGYKFVLETPTSILLGTWDNIYGYTTGSADASMEVQTATAGQTLFVLNTMVYEPGTNTLGVYVDGVNQVVNNAYIETNSTSVTFVSGLHAGAVVKFINVNIASTTANVVTYAPGFTGSVATTVEDKLQQYVSVKDFGAVGDGVTDDRAAIQACIDYVESIVDENARPEIFFPGGTYAIASSYPSASLPQGTFGSYSNFENNTFGLCIRDGRSVRLTGSSNVSIVDQRTGSTALFAFVKAGAIRDFSMSNILFVGNTSVQANAPQYIIKAYCTFIHESSFYNVNCQGAQIAVWEMNVWGTEFTKCKASHSWRDGFVFTCQNYTGAWVGLTSLNLVNCYALLTQRWGYVFLGDPSNRDGYGGWNFMAMRTCYGDKIGWSPTTVAQSNVYAATSAGIYGENTRNFLVNNCGFEDCFRLASIKKSIANCLNCTSSTGTGYADGITNVGAYIPLETCRSITLTGISFEGYNGPRNAVVSHIVDTAYSDYTINIPDKWIVASEVSISPNVANVSTTLLNTQQDFYDAGAIKLGSLLRYEGEKFANGSPTTIENARRYDAFVKQYKLNNLSASPQYKALLSVLNADRAKNGMISVDLDIVAVAQGSAPSRWTVGASIGYGSQFTNTAVNLSTGGLATALSLSWDNSSGTDYKLVLAYGNSNNQMFFVKMTVSSNYGTETPLYTILS